MGLWFKALYVLVFTLFSATNLFAADAEDSAVVLMYHRFGEDDFPTTNIKLDQFDAHVAELSQEKYNVVPLDVIVEAMRSGQKLPPRTIAITIDDAFYSIYSEAWPRLKAAGLPFTIFASAEPLDNGTKGYMTWDQIREIQKDPLVTIGHHGYSHGRLSTISTSRAERDIKKASERYQTELGYVPTIFAYPFGEFDAELIEILKSNGLKAAFGQYSSAFNSQRNIMTLPRFALNEKYSGMGRFRLIVNARALPVSDILPRQTNEDLKAVNNPPAIGFTVDRSVGGLSALNCFPSHLGEAAKIQIIDSNRVEIRFDKPYPRGRNRLNCTLPGPEKRWYWFGLPFFNLIED